MSVSPSRRSWGTNAKGIALVLSQVLPVMAAVSLFPAIPKLGAAFAGHAHAALLVPMIVTLPSLLVAIGSPFAGIAADRFGRRWTFISGLALYCFTGLVPVVTGNLETIIASRGVLGIAEAIIMATSSAMIADYFGEERHSWVAWVGIAQSAFGTLLVLAGGALSDWSWRGPFMLYGFAIPIFLLALIVIDEPAELTGAEMVNAAYPWRAALLIGSVTLVTAICYYVEPLHIAAVLFAKGTNSATEAGFIQAMTSLAYLAGTFAYRGLHRLPVGQLLAACGLLVGLGVLVMALAPNANLVTTGAFVQQLGAGMVIPTLLAWGQSILPPAQRARGMGIWATAFFSGLFLCPPLVTLIGDRVGGLQPALLVMGGATLLLTPLPLILLGRPRSAITPGST